MLSQWRSGIEPVSTTTLANFKSGSSEYAGLLGIQQGRDFGAELVGPDTLALMSYLG